MTHPPGFDYKAAGWNATGSDWYLAEFAGALTGNRTYTLQDSDMTLAAINLAQTFSEDQTIEKNQDATTSFTLRNTSAGTAARARMLITNGTSSLNFGLLGTGNNTLPTLGSPGEGYITVGASDMEFGVTTTGKVIKFLAGGLANAAGMPSGQWSRTDLRVRGYDAATNTSTEILSIDHETSGTPAAGFGAHLSAYLETSGVGAAVRQLAGALRWVWTTSSHATRAAKAVISVVLAGTETERVEIGDSIKLGDIAGGNYTEIENDGTIEFIGNATVWDDLRIEPTARTTGGNAPTFEKWFDDSGGTSRGVYLYSFDDAVGGSEKEVFFTIQMPHSWAGTSIDFHVHWVGAVSDTTAEPRWGLEYAWKDIGETFGDTTIIYAATKTPTDPDVTAGKHYLTAFSTIAPGATADGISSILIGRLFRDSANAGDTYNATGAKCGLLSIDAHYEINTIGSRSEFTK